MVRTQVADDGSGQRPVGEGLGDGGGRVRERVRNAPAGRGQAKRAQQPFAGADGRLSVVGGNLGNEGS